MIFFRMMGRLTVRFFAGLGRALGGIFKAMVRHPLGTVFTVLLVGGLVAGWVATDGFGIKLNGANGSSVVTTQASETSTGKSEEFLNAFGKLDANGMWNTLSDSYKQALLSKGIANSEAMQKLLNAKVTELAKNSNSKPKYRFTWARGQTNSDGSAMDIFRGDIEWAAAGANMPRLVAYLITVDGNGKVSNVDSQNQSQTDSETADPLLSAAFSSEKKKDAKEAGYGETDAKRKAATEEFMAGVTNFDAKRIWNTLSPVYQKELNDKKVTVDSMQKVFDQIKKQAADGKFKLGYAGFTLRLSANYPNGNSLDEYWASLQVGDEVSTPGYSLLLDTNFKIIAIGTQDPVLSPALGRKQGQ